MAKRGRPTKCKLPKEVFREYLLNKLVDESGDKVSLRKIFSDVNFMEYTGYFNKKLDDGTYKPISPGSISYIIRTHDLYELEVFYHHKFITKKISSHVTFSRFSREKNRGYKKGRYKNSMSKYNNVSDIPKERLAWALNSLSKRIPNCPELDVGFADANMSYNNLQNYLERLEMYFVVGEDKKTEEDFIVEFRNRLSAFRKSYVGGD